MLYFSSQITLIICCLLFISSSFSKSAKYTQGSVSVTYTNNERHFEFVPNRRATGNDPATATFNDEMDKKGWGILKVETNPSSSDLDQYYGAGYLECYMTAEYIHSAYQNMYDYFFGTLPPSKQLLQWLKDQDAWVRNQTSGNYEDLSPFWKQVALLVQQFDGCVSGYQDSGMPFIGVFGIQLLNDLGDLLDLKSAVNSEMRVDWENMSPQEFRQYIMSTGHCSAIVKVTGDLGELYSGHSSWFTYGSMIRIYKHYHFQTNEKFSSKKISFSSYPGTLSSLDDFYIMDSGLVLLQTTNNIFNQSLYDLVVPESLLAWQRVRIANTMSSNGSDWANYVSQYNSGTYNNQYMVIDYNLWDPNQPLKDGLLWVIEQIPGYIESYDQTNKLELGYWPSYNVPYYLSIYEKSGYPQIVNRFGTDYSYDLAPRAKIFRRDQATVTDIDSLKDILRSNNYLQDPYSFDDPWNAICSRGDLSSSPSASGCYDTKVTQSKWVFELEADIINGPTTSNGLPPFEWTSEFNSTAHYGQPDRYDFSWIKVSPEW